MFSVRRLIAIILLVHFVSLAYHCIILIYVHQLVLVIDGRSWTYFKHSAFHCSSDYILWIKCENLKEKTYCYIFTRVYITVNDLENNEKVILCPTFGVFFSTWHPHNKSNSPFIVSSKSFIISYIYDEWKNMTNSHLTDLKKTHQCLNVNLSMMYVKQYILHGM